MRYLTLLSLLAPTKKLCDMYAVLGNQTSCAGKVMRDVHELICGEFP